MVSVKCCRAQRQSARGKLSVEGEFSELGGGVSSGEMGFGARGSERGPV